MKFDRDVHGAQRMNLNDFRDSLMFHLVPSVDQNLYNTF